MLKVIELFAGIGSQTQALKNIGVDHEVVAVAEWDKYAYQSYQAIHGPTPNLGDITKVESLPECDLLTYSFPCQDISVAGNQGGLKRESGTRSGLLWEVERLLLDYERRDQLPKYLLLENVKNLVGKKHKVDFMEWLASLELMGYQNHWKVLNAKHYGVPQNRERVFVVSILGGGDYEWPEPFDNGIRLKDMLEDEVDEKYYIDEEKCSRLLSQLNTLPENKSIGNTNPSGRGMNGEVWCGDMSPTVTTNKGEGHKIVVPVLTPDRVEKRQNGRRFKEEGDPPFTLTSQDRHGILVKTNNQAGEDIAHVGDTINIENQASTTRRGRIGKGVAQTLNTAPSQVVVIGDKECNMLGHIDINGHDYIKRVYSEEGLVPTVPTVPTGAGGNHEPKVYTRYRIRKLTPLCCWRLMGFKDQQFRLAESVVSNSQLYKQAGNSIVVDVLEYIFTNLLLEESLR